MAKKFKLPQGIMDYLPDECFSKNALEDALIACYKDYGYKQIDTPILERYDLYNSGIAKMPLKKLFKVTDIDGDLLVLRPDMTMPISRIVCTKLPNDNYKLCYKGRGYSMLEDSGKLREYSQVGVEVLGSKGNGVDIEIVMLAIESVLNTGLQDFQIEIGHVGYFKGLLQSMHLTNAEVDELVDLVEKKDSIGEQVFAKRVGLDKNSLDLILKLPMMFGGIEVLEEAQSLCVNDTMTSAIANLKAIYDGVKALGYEKYITFDLSIVGKMKYYSGMVMKGITKTLGRPFLNGGRYDELCDSFGKSMPAVGFAIYVGYLLEALDSLGIAPKDQDVEVVVGFISSKKEEASLYVAELKASGINAIKSFATTKEQLLKCKLASNAKKAIFINEDAKEEV